MSEDKEEKYVTAWPDHFIIDSDSCDLCIEHKDGKFDVKQTHRTHLNTPYTTNIPFKGDVSESLMRAMLEVAESFYNRGFERGKAKKTEEIKKVLGIR